ncbi:hypothetical protein [Jiella mangrovi]|uniref:Uncharacterized protein n=1 Tax=Jiella mangrovi TaxID=2821407 RepID=A0ABS4BHM8_9HYPH|nr:hypothetical protein [Jiella mangrovi]MBP0615696.1 hypothetical protein [Jiella mangrovi]
MSVRRLFELYEIAWMFESHAQQRLGWRDAAEARRARIRSERLAAQQLQAMLDANPSGSLGHAHLDDEEALRRAGLLP